MNLRRLQMFLLVATLGLITSSTGCRNRGPFLANNSFGPLGGQTTVAPPNTYSLQIPGQQNFNQGSGVRQATNVQPNSVNVQNGWQPAGATNQPANATTVQPAGQGSTTSTNSTIFNNTTTQTVAVTPNRQNNNVIGTRVAQNNSGLSFTDRTNFRTTAVDERLDQSRLPVTDASQVRAPTNFSPATTVGQFNAPYYVPNQQPVNNLAPQYQNTQQRFATNPSNGQSINPNLAQSRTTVVGAFGQPVFMQPPQRPYTGLNTQNQVLAQATVYADPANDPNIQAGWTNPELTASRNSLNR